MTAKASRGVPVLITWDVDPDLWLPLDRRKPALNAAINLCQHQGVHATFFCTAQSAQGYLEEFERMKAQGHEIGCHGLTHGDEEDYNRMPEEMQRAYIMEATQCLQALAGKPIRAFRSPRVKTMPATLKLLAENGYWSDSSVCSQRLDLVSSNLINLGWLVAPRRPYHPNRNSAFQRGDISLWEIPISAAIAPFISATLRVVGQAGMKALFRLLYTESRQTGKPIVYLAHPIEFAPLGRKGKTRRWHRELGREYFSFNYIRTHGLRLRNLISQMDSESLLNHTAALFAYMASFPDVEFMTVSEYTANRLGNTGGSASTLELS